MRRTREAVETRWHPAGEGTHGLNGLKTGDGRIDGNKEQVKDRGAETGTQDKQKKTGSAELKLPLSSSKVFLTVNILNLV